MLQSLGRDSVLQPSQDFQGEAHRILQQRRWQLSFQFISCDGMCLTRLQEGVHMKWSCIHLVICSPANAALTSSDSSMHPWIDMAMSCAHPAIILLFAKTQVTSDVAQGSTALHCPQTKIEFCGSMLKLTNFESDGLNCDLSPANRRAEASAEISQVLQELCC